MRPNGANKTIPHPLPYPPLPEFWQIDSFLKPALNILILWNLIVGWGKGVIKEGAGTLHKSYTFSGGV